MPEQHHTVLGFDFGTVWIGTAVGQTRTMTASPLEPVRVIQHQPDWNKIARLIETWQPDRLIVGLPLNMDDQEQQISEKARRFSRQLEGRFHIKTELIDERLTTREAWHIVENQAHNKVSKSDIDSIAAVLITETWLTHQQHKENF